MKKILYFLFLTLTIIIVHSCSPVFLEKSSFISVKGNKFVKNGAPYYFMGTNFWFGCYIGSPGESGDRGRLERELDFLVENNITNLRVLASSEESTIKNSLKPAVQNKPGEYNEQLLEGLDFLISEMGKRGMHAVIFLNNYWEWSGGFSQYEAWFGKDTALDLGDPKVPWPKWNEHVSAFYSNKEANKYFRKFIESIITRKNKFNGLYYYEDPTIMTWQLANEPRPGTGEAGVRNLPNFYNWIDETAAFIHELAPNQLVTTGNEGAMGSLNSEEFYAKAHSSANIDYLTFHLWAKNWRWIDVENMSGTYDAAEKNAVDYIDAHVRLVDELNKPITLEEFGFPRDDEKYDPGSETTFRDKYYKTIFEQAYKNASAGGPLGGTNFWTWGGEGRTAHSDFKWRKGDAFMGDPPQEPQGLNSVLNSDQSTLKLISDYGKKMIELSRSN